jgi:hypothetical protein
MTSRRHLLALLCAPATLLAAADAPAALMTSGPRPPWVRLIMHFNHQNDLTAIGEACLRARPTLCSSDAEGIYRALVHWVGAPTGRSATVLAALQARIADDFEHGKVESVGGWQLSHTEVLLAVLAAKSDLRV